MNKVLHMLCLEHDGVMGPACLFPAGIHLLDLGVLRVTFGGADRRAKPCLEIDGAHTMERDYGHVLERI